MSITAPRGTNHAAQVGMMLSGWIWLACITIVAGVVGARASSLSEVAWVYSSASKTQPSTMDIESTSGTFDLIWGSLAAGAIVLLILSVLFWALRRRIVADGLVVALTLIPLVFVGVLVGDPLGSLIPQLGHELFTHQQAIASIPWSCHLWDLGFVLLAAAAFAVGVLISRRLPTPSPVANSESDAALS